ncbi:MAG: L-2-amino-thiazoline-4-carboxylic acid hydrolase [Deltaproteobacteria bacterium]|nr:L-2-amino-thiazoline-4-carboxylic acid hydrolase [Deltaproteobacteria bacterium]
MKTIYYGEHQGEIRGLSGEFYEEIENYVQERYGLEKAQTIKRTALEDFQDILINLPDIGGDKNPLIWTYIQAAVSLGFFLAAKVNGLSIEEAGRINYELIESYYLSEEGASSEQTATPESITKQRERMKAASGKLLWPEGWRTVYVEPAQPSFDIGWDNTECGILKLYDKYGAREFVPYICMLDILIYPLRGLGIKRSRTLVESDHCDFRVKLQGHSSLERFAQQRLKEWDKNRD